MALFRWTLRPMVFAKHVLIVDDLGWLGRERGSRY